MLRSGVLSPGTCEPRAMPGFTHFLFRRSVTGHLNLETLNSQTGLGIYSVLQLVKSAADCIPVRALPVRAQWQLA